MSSSYRLSNLPIVVRKPAGPRNQRVVSFARDAVTGVSRPLEHTEAWTLYKFEVHSRECNDCQNPNARRRLCDKGHIMAQNIAKYLYTKADGEAYSTSSTDDRVVRVELPPNYDNVRILLRAIDDNRRDRGQTVSMDRTYHVAPRVPTKKRGSRYDEDQERLYRDDCRRPLEVQAPSPRDFHHHANRVYYHVG